MRAEVVKLVDAVDSKSTGLLARAGSIPAFGTIICKEHIGKIAIRQYSMVMASRHPQPVYSFSSECAKIATYYTGILCALLKPLISLKPVEV